MNVLDRDNVGIVLRLSPRQYDEENIIVSTTHILYNKKRHDIKLAQVHLLLAEIERVSYKGYITSNKFSLFICILINDNHYIFLITFIELVIVIFLNTIQ